MTCIVGLNTSDRLFVAGDSASIEHQSMRIQKRPDEKVFIRKTHDGNEMLFGFCSSWRLGQLLRYVVKIPKHQPGMFVNEYLVSSFIPELQACLFKSHAVLNPGQGIGQVVVAYCGHLFTIESDFSLTHHTNGLVAVGVGTDIALGSLFTSETYMIDPVERIEKALDAASEFNAGVCKPYTIMSIGKTR